MSATSPRVVRSALHSGLVDLFDHPVALAAALLCGAASSLAFSSASRGALLVLAQGRPGRALFVWILGGSLGVLLGGAGLAAIPSAGRDPSEPVETLLRLAPSRSAATGSPSSIETRPKR